METVPWRMILLCLSFVLFVCAAVGWAPEPWPWRTKLIAGGLACFVLAQFIPGR